MILCRHTLLSVTRVIGGVPFQSFKLGAFREVKKDPAKQSSIAELRKPVTSAAAQPTRPASIQTCRYVAAPSASVAALKVGRR